MDGRERKEGDVESINRLVQGILDRLPKDMREISYALDMMQVEDGSWKLVELNPGGDSGLYDPHVDVLVANYLASHYLGKPTPFMEKWTAFKSGKTLDEKIRAYETILKLPAIQHVKTFDDSLMSMESEALVTLMKDIAKIKSEKEFSKVVDFIDKNNLGWMLSYGHMEKLIEVANKVHYPLDSLKETFNLSKFEHLEMLKGKPTFRFDPVVKAKGSHGEIRLPRNAQPLPITRQERPYSCGTACTKSLLNYWGLPVDTEESLYDILGTTEDGTHPRSIEKAMKEEFGLEVQLKENVSLGKIKRALKSGETVMVGIQAWASEEDLNEMPWAVRWHDGHYVLITAVDDKNVYLMDPSVEGKYSHIPKKEFVERWHDLEVDSKGEIWKHKQLAIFVRGDKAPAQIAQALNCKIKLKKINRPTVGRTY